MLRGNRFFSRLGFICFVFLTSCSVNTRTSGNSAKPKTGEPTVNATILKVIDGDTVTVKIARKKETLRLIGVDTPETVHPTKGVECFGPEASNFTKLTLKKDLQVRLVRDVEARDRYQRLLVYIYLQDGTMFNLILVEQGFARAMNIEPNSAFATEFAMREAEARTQQIGLWGACER